MHAELLSCRICGECDGNNIMNYVCECEQLATALDSCFSLQWDRLLARNGSVFQPSTLLVRRRQALCFVLF